LTTFGRNIQKTLEYSLHVSVSGSVRRNFQNLRYFGVRFERRKVDKKSKPTRKLKHANSILDYFEYFCQMRTQELWPRKWKCSNSKTVTVTAMGCSSWVLQFNTLTTA